MNSVLALINAEIVLVLHVIPSSTCFNDRLAGNRFVRYSISPEWSCCCFAGADTSRCCETMLKHKSVT